MRFGDANMVRDFDSFHEFRELPEGDIFEELFLGSCFICQSASCMRTDLVRKLDIPRVPLLATTTCTELASEVRRPQDVVCCYACIEVISIRATRACSARRSSSSSAGSTASIGRVRAAHRMRAASRGSAKSTRENVGGGFRRILKEGSISYLLTRPLTRARRVLRRAIRYAVHGVGVAKRPRYS
jgi:hypothetical protein